MLSLILLLLVFTIQWKTRKRVPNNSLFSPPRDLYIILFKLFLCIFCLFFAHLIRVFSMKPSYFHFFIQVVTTQVLQYLVSASFLWQFTSF